MNAEYLLDAIGLLDDGLIREAERYTVRKRRTHYGAWLGLAACLAVVAVLSYGVTHLGMGGGAPSNEASGGATSAPANQASPSASNGGPEEPPAAGGSSGSVGSEPVPAPSSGESDYCAAIVVDGVLYWSTGTPVSGEVAEEAIRTVTGYTDAVPEEDGQTNFDQSLTTRYAMTDLGLVVLIDHEWVLFDPVPPWEK